MSKELLVYYGPWLVYRHEFPNTKWDIGKLVMDAAVKLRASLCIVAPLDGSLVNFKIKPACTCKCHRRGVECDVDEQSTHVPLMQFLDDLNKMLEFVEHIANIMGDADTLDCYGVAPAGFDPLTPEASEPDPENDLEYVMCDLDQFIDRAMSNAVDQAVQNAQQALSESEMTIAAYRDNNSVMRRRRRS